MKIDIYTDGACSGNPGPGGWGFVIINKNSNETLYRDSGANKSTTNNRMELTAVIEALKKIKSENINITENIEISVYTDSQYVKNGITAWIFNWKKNNWKASTKKPVKNQDLWQELDKLSIEIAPKWNWVRGHAGNFYNEECDRLAVEAIGTL